MSEGTELGLDPVIHAVARLRITSVLAALPEGDALSFPRLQSLLDLTAGNLITHLRRLEEADYVDVARTGAGRSASTTVRLTPTGRAAFTRYSETLRSLLDGGDGG